MWQWPVCEDFVVVEDGISEGIGKVNHTFFHELQCISLDLLVRVKNQLYQKHHIISELIPTLEHLLH